MSVEKILFGVSVETNTDSSVEIVIEREDGEKRMIQFPAAKIKLYRAVNGNINSLISFLLGES